MLSERSCRAIVQTMSRPLIRMLSQTTSAQRKLTRVASSKRAMCTLRIGSRRPIWLAKSSAWSVLAVKELNWEVMPGNSSALPLACGRHRATELSSVLVENVYLENWKDSRSWVHVCGVWISITPSSLKYNHPPISLQLS